MKERRGASPLCTPRRVAISIVGRIEQSEIRRHRDAEAHCEAPTPRVSFLRKQQSRTVFRGPRPVVAARSEPMFMTPVSVDTSDASRAFIHQLDTLRVSSIGFRKPLQHDETGLPGWLTCRSVE